jgi:alpha-mannosidase
VQPDSLLPSAEAHVRNLLEGRRTGAAFGAVSAVAYTPDSFGHPAQLPQLFRGFGLGLFVYWRGNGDEIDGLPAEYLWEAPDGSTVLAHHLAEGYFAASGLPTEPRAAAAMLTGLAERLAARTRSGAVLLMNGFDHALPEAGTGAAAEALARASGFAVRRALLDDFARALPPEAPRFRGELTGARVANLLPGVWSTRTPLKLRNRRAEAQLEGWAEPWAGLGALLGLPDERPALRTAWRALLQNEAHDSLCGCSQDRVHEQMAARYDVAEELAAETTTRVLERLAGLGVERRTPWTTTFDAAVWNPSPHTRTDVVRLRLDPVPWLAFRGEQEREMALHPWLLAALGDGGFTVDGVPARLVTDDDAGRVRIAPERPALTLEFVAADVPASGWRRVHVAPAAAVPDREDDGREIAADGLSVRAADDGTLTVGAGGRTWTGLCALEDVGDRGDTYDFDPVAGGAIRVEAVAVRRHVHASGIQRLTVERTLLVPAALAEDRRERSAARARLVVEMEARVAPGVPRVDLRVRVHNTARDHRLRLRFPTGGADGACLAASSADVVRRGPERPDAARWVHPAPATFVQQGFVAAGGLTVVAPGLPEAEVTADGVLAITLVRAVGWLARMDLTTRPQVAGPSVPTPGAQCLETIEARLALLPGVDVRAARDAELGLRACAAGPAPLVPPGTALLAVEPRALVVSALKPAVDGRGGVLRVLNPTDDPLEARVDVGVPIAAVEAILLDETPAANERVALSGRLVSFAVPPHALRSVRLVG